MAFFPQQRPRFDAALRDVDAKTPTSRALAAESLGTPPAGREDEAKRALRRLIDDPHGDVRAAALSSTGRLRDHDAIDLVLLRIEDGDPTVRQVAILAAGDLGGERAGKALMRLLSHERPEVRFQAVSVVAELAPEGAVSALMRRLKDDDREVRARAADGLGALEDPSSADALAKALKDEAAAVRKSAAIALARVHDDRGAEQLVLALSDNERCFEAAWALGEIRAQIAVEPLARLSASLLQPLAVRAAAAAALVRLGDARGVSELRKVLKAWRSDARSYAVDLVGELECVELAPEIAALAKRPRGADPAAVTRTLEKLAGKSEIARRALSGTT